MKTKLFPPWIIRFFFIVGIISAIFFRLLVVFNYFWQPMGRVVWYCGVIGYILFFGFRFYISRKRRRVIIENDLINKLEEDSLNREEREEIQYILSSLIKSKEMINYIFIFALSGMAIVVDVTLYLVTRVF